MRILFVIAVATLLGSTFSFGQDVILGDNEVRTIKVTLTLFAAVALLASLLFVRMSDNMLSSGFVGLMILVLIFGFNALVVFFTTGKFDVQIWLSLFRIGLCVPLLLGFRRFFPGNSLRVISILSLTCLSLIVTIAWYDPLLGYREIFFDGSTEMYRLGGNIIPPNTLGHLAAFVSLVIFAGGDRRRVSWLLAITLCIYVIYATASRGAAVSFILMHLIVLICRNRQGNPGLRAGLYALLLFCITIIFFFVAYVLGVAEIGFGEGFMRGDLSGFGGRDSLWRMAVGIFVENDLVAQLFGQGYGIRDLLLYTQEGQMMNSAHNGFIHLLLTTGLVGLCTYLLFFFIVGLEISRSKPNCTLYALLLGFILMNLIELGPFVEFNAISIVAIAMMADAGRNVLDKGVSVVRFS